MHILESRTYLGTSLGCPFPYNPLVGSFIRPRRIPSECVSVPKEICFSGLLGLARREGGKFGLQKGITILWFHQSRRRLVNTEPKMGFRDGLRLGCHVDRRRQRAPFAVKRLSPSPAGTHKEASGPPTPCSLHHARSSPTQVHKPKTTGERRPLGAVLWLSRGRPNSRL